MQWYCFDVNQFLNYLEKCYERGPFNTHLGFVKPFEDLSCHGIQDY